MFVVLVCIILHVPVKYSFGDPVSQHTSIRRSIASPVIETFATHRTMQQPDSSVLEKNGYHFNFNNKSISLLRIKDRFTFAYSNHQSSITARFRKRPFFQNANFRQFKSDERALEIVTFDKIKNEIDRKSGREVFDKILSETKDDPSLTYVAPVYYDPQSRDEVIFTNRISVSVTDDQDPILKEKLGSLLDARFEKVLMPQVLIYTCNDMSRGDALDRCMSIENEPGVLWVQPEMILKTEKCFAPNDPLFFKQWHLRNTGENGSTIGADMKVADAWDIQRMADTSITIAVLDQGVDLLHPDLNITFGWNFFNDTDDPSPSRRTDEHGTAVAGIAAAIGNNGIGVAGVAAGARIMPLKILDDIQTITDTKIASAFTWAYEQGADVLNNSWSLQSATPSNSIRTAIKNASTLGRGNKGALVFCSSGNNGKQFDAYVINISWTAECRIAFVYKKDVSGSSEQDNIFLDNIYIHNSDGDSVVFLETFSGTSLPNGWSTSGGFNGSLTPISSISGWACSTSVYQQGFGGQSSFCSGKISDNQWTELRMPLRTFNEGEKLYINAHMSVEDDYDSLICRIYSPSGSLMGEFGISSTSTATPASVINYPAAMDSSIAVGASTDLDFRSDYSQYNVAGTGKTVDFVAPSGGGFFGTTTTDIRGLSGYDSTGDYYNNFSGTSSSCPAASGLAALILSKNPELSRNKVLEVMRATCDKIGGVTYTNGKHKEYGYGRLNAKRALENLPPVITGQNAIAVLKSSPRVLTIDDLVIFDSETPDGPFALTVYSGSNYTVSGTTITVTSVFSGPTLSVPVSVNDGGTYESDKFTLTVTVQNTNTAPVITGQIPVSMFEDGKFRIMSGNLTITDPEGGPFIITPAAGANYTIIGDSIAPLADSNGTLTVPVTASDGLVSSASFPVTVTVTPVNDAPSFTAGSNISIPENNGQFSLASWATNLNKGPANESSQTLNFIVSATNGGLFDALPSINASGALQFIPKDYLTGTSTVNVRLKDNGGTANGGQDESAPQVFTITINAINFPPSFIKGADITIPEDAGIQTIPWATNVNPGAPSETGQILQFTLTNNNSSLFSVQPQITPDGVLTFTAAPNRFGIAQLTARLHDNGGGNDSSAAQTFVITITNINDPPSFTAGSNQIVNEDAGSQTIASWARTISAGPYEPDIINFKCVASNPSLFSALPAINEAGVLTYTAAANISDSTTVSVRLYDGMDSSASASFTITVNPVNDPPVFTPGPVISVPEDSPSQLLISWGTISKGPSDEAAQAITTIALAISDTTIFSAKPSITADGTLSFTPAANKYGTASITVSLADNGGTLNGGVSSSTSSPFTITIQPVNDIPRFTPGSDVIVQEDQGNQSFNGWASNIDAGPGEVSQTLTFTTIASNASLFSSMPSIDSNGKLTFTTANNANGTSSVRVRLRDSGGTLNGGIDSSSEVSFTISVTPVNDAPTIVINGNGELSPDSTSIIVITASDIDGESPAISLQNLPSFTTVTNTGNGTATITCQPTKIDTGNFTITIIANDGFISSDTNYNLHVQTPPAGIIQISGVSAQAVTHLYSSAGWIGTPLLTGPGVINSLKPGTYLLAISDKGVRTRYFYGTVATGKIDTIDVVAQPQFPISFSSANALQTMSGPLIAGSLVSVVVDDADNDCKPDIVFIGTDGIIRFCKGNGVSFADPVIICRGFTGNNILRCVDWNNDGLNDLLMVNITGTVWLCPGTENGTFSLATTLINIDPGCTGMEPVADPVSGKAMYIGYSNGTVQHITFSSDNSHTVRNVMNKTGQVLNVGNDADVTVFDQTGNGNNELIIGNSTGNVQIFTLKTADTVKTSEVVSIGGMPFGQMGRVLLSSTLGIGTELPALIYSDNSGVIYKSVQGLHGDVTGDGKVDIFDLQQLGIHWGQHSGDPGWSAATNLSATPVASGSQVINIFDLQVLGNCWGLKK
jgi:subtilisin family serine protease